MRDHFVRPRREEANLGFALLQHGRGTVLHTVMRCAVLQLCQLLVGLHRSQKTAVEAIKNGTLSSFISIQSKCATGRLLGFFTVPSHA